MRFLLFLLIGLNYNSVYGQLGGCTSPGLPPCRCNTATVLCDVQQLDGVTYQMSTFNNAGNAPSYFCYQGDNTAPQNPTWYAFPSYCSSLSLQISYSGCTGTGSNRGLQAAVYSDCNNLPGSIVSGGCGAEWTCPFPFTNCMGCGVTNGVRTLNLTGLTPGSVYYLLVDGCGGSACTVNIQITSPPCPPPPIALIPQDPQGPTDVCAGQQYTYTGVLPAGATNLHWFVNGVQIGPPSPSNTFNYVFPSAGPYELCLDVSNACTPAGDPPAQRCINVQVTSPNAGMLSAMPNPTCPENTINYNVTGHNSSYSQYLVVVNAAGQIVQVDAATSGSFTHNACANFTLYSINIRPGALPDPAVGSNFTSIACATNCCSTSQITLNFIDTTPPVFVNPPANLSVNCYLNVPSMENLDWNDNCSMGGSVMGTQMQSFTNCGGGTITRTWTVTDGCGNTATHVQTITIAPIPVASFTAPPDITINCEEVPAAGVLPIIAYDNGVIGDCAITGTMIPSRTDMIMNCSGTITYLWMDTDFCGRAITHTQVITVLPPDAPTFINPPANITVNCADIPPASFLPQLNYSNGATGSCLIEGNGVVPERNDNIVNCEGTITYTWQITDPCNRNIQYVQTITVDPPVIPAFINPPGNITIDCENIPASDFLPPLAFTNGEIGSCEISGSVIPSRIPNIINCQGTITYFWTFTDNCNRSITHTQILTVNPPPPPEFINPPGDLTIACDQIGQIATLLELSYSNNSSGDCLISGNSIATRSDEIINCEGTITLTWIFTDPCNRTITHQRLISVEAPPLVSLINPPVFNTPISCADAANFTVGNIAFSNNSSNCEITGIITPQITNDFTSCGGNIQINWNGLDDCNRTVTYNQIVLVQNAAMPAFTSNLPVDLTINCQDISQYLIPLNYSNNLTAACQIEGSILPTVVQDYNLCGGSATITWSLTDNCNNILSHIQQITILPAPLAVFINPPPANITLQCDQVPEFPPFLDFSNGSSGICEITGNVQAIQSGTYNSCGGTLQYTWQYLDACGRPLVYTQNVTVLPSPDPTFIDPPSDFFLPCGVSSFMPAPLAYTNGLNGACGVGGEILPTTTNFGSYIEANWTYQNSCNNTTVTALQRAHISPYPDIVINPQSVDVCEGASFNLSSVQVTNLNNNPVTLSYHFDTPASSSNILAFSNVNPYQTTNYYIQATNAFGCSDEAPFTLNVIPTAISGTAINGAVCLDQQQLSLWDYIFGYSSDNGFWTNANNLGLNLDNPNQVVFPGNISPGTYAFDYTVPSSVPQCPSSTTRVFIEFLDSGDYDITNIICNAGFTEYTISLYTQDLFVQSNLGMVVNLGAGNYEIRNIPITMDIILTFSGFTAGCNPFSVTLSPPNCSCPNIAALPAVAPIRVCSGSPNPTLTVNPGTGFTANWYSAATGGILLQGMSSTYTPTVTMPGVYNYWVDREDLTSGCKSSTRTQVQFEILNNPTVMNATLTRCDNNVDGFFEFNLANANSSITSNPGNTVSYFATIDDANTEVNPLPIQFTNTTPNTQTIFAVVKNSNNCKSVAELQLIVRPLPIFSVNVEDETCISLADGALTIDVTNGNGPFQYSLDNVVWSDVNSFSGLIPKDYIIYVRNTFQCISQTTITVAEGQRIEISNFTSSCSNNGTSSNNMDDLYSLSFVVNSTIMVSNQYSVEYNSTNLGMFSYGVPVNLNIPADASTGTLVITDLMSGCRTTRNIGPLNPCSTECLITVSGLTTICNDNNTESDNTDDFYTITFNTSVANGGSQNMYSILVDNVILSSHSYGEQISFNLPAGGNSPEIILRDNQNLICTTTLPVQPLTPCSNRCIITTTVSNILCNDSGTINDPSDDTFTFSIRVTGSNISSGWKIEGMDSVRTYMNNHVMGPYPISGGNITLSIVDSEDNICITTATIMAPPACSEPCVLELGELVIGACNNAGTNNTANDDNFSISFKINIQSGSASIYRVSDGNNDWGPFIYGNAVNINNLPANGNNIVLTVSDQSNSGCNFSFSVNQTPCSECTQSVDAGPDIQLSCLVNTAQLNGTSSVPATTYRWTGPNNFVQNGQSAQTATPGVYYFTATFADQCVARDSMSVSVDADLPIANAGPDNSITCLVNEVTLTGSSNVSSMNAAYEWTDQTGSIVSTTINFTVTTPGTYFFQVTNTENNCTSGKDEVVVIEDTEKPIAVIYADPGNLLDCVVSSIVLSGEPQENVFFDWQVGELTYSKVASIIVTREGLITMIAVDSISGCTESNQIQIIDLQDYPILVVEPATPITCDNNLTTINASNSPIGPNLVYTWLDSNSNPISGQSGNQLIVNTPGTYYVILTDTLNKCSNIDSVIVQSIGDFPDFAQPADINLFCGVNQSAIAIQIQNNQANMQISWTTSGGQILSGNNTQSINVLGSGLYTVEVIFPESGCKTTRSINVNVNDARPEAVSLITEDESCAGNRDASINIGSIEGGTPPYNFRLNNQDLGSNLNATALQPGSYNLLVTDSNGCTLSRNIILNPGNDIDITLASEIEVRRGDTTTLEVKVNLPDTEIASVLWLPSENLSCDTCLITNFFGTRDSEYQVIIKDINGCESTARVRLSVIGTVIITVPNIFNPKGSINNYFSVSANNAVELIEKLRIFDRWGNLLFSNEKFAPNIPQAGWDGTHKGQDVVPGVYLFFIEYRTISGLEIYTGDVTIIR